MRDGVVEILTISTDLGIILFPAGVIVVQFVCFLVKEHFMRGSGTGG